MSLLGNNDLWIIDTIETEEKTAAKIILPENIKGVALLKTIDGIFRLIKIPETIEKVIDILEINIYTNNIVILTKHSMSSDLYLDLIYVKDLNIISFI